MTREVLEKIAATKLPDDVDRRMQSLMDRNNEGLLTDQEKRELELLVEASESIGLLRAKAMHLLGRKP